MTSVAISARFSTGPGQVGAVEIPYLAGQRGARDTVVTDPASPVTAQARNGFTDDTGTLQIATDRDTSMHRLRRLPPYA